MTTDKKEKQFHGRIGEEENALVREACRLTGTPMTTKARELLIIWAREIIKEHGEPA